MKKPKSIKKISKKKAKWVKKPHKGVIRCAACDSMMAIINGVSKCSNVGCASHSW